MDRLRQQVGAVQTGTHYLSITELHRIPDLPRLASLQ